MLLLNATLADDSRRDVRIERERIVGVLPGGSATPAPGEEVLDLSRYVLLPAPAEPHAHLDKALTADRFRELPTDLESAIAAWHAHRSGLEVEEMAARAHAAARLSLVNGATAIRTHVDVGPGVGLRGVEALTGVREELRGLIDVQIAALAYPVTGQAGRENLVLLREALAMGADVVGGAPHVDPAPRESLEMYIGVAAELSLPVDLHMDEHTRAGSIDLVDMLDIVGTGFPHAATASHCVSLGLEDVEAQTEIAGAVGAAGVSVVTLPLANLYLQGRDQPQATPRGLTALRPLLAAGVTVAGGGDNVQDVFVPLGRADPLATAQLLVVAGHLEIHEAYGLVSDGAREVMGLSPLRVAPGFPADLLAVAGSSLREALAMTPEERIVFKGGRIVVRSRLQREFLNDLDTSMNRSGALL